MLLQLNYYRTMYVFFGKNIHSDFAYRVKVFHIQMLLTKYSSICFPDTHSDVVTIVKKCFFVILLFNPTISNLGMPILCRCSTIFNNMLYWQTRITPVLKLQVNMRRVGPLGDIRYARRAIHSAIHDTMYRLDILRLKLSAYLWMKMRCIFFLFQFLWFIQFRIRTFTAVTYSGQTNYCISSQIFSR